MLLERLRRETHNLHLLIETDLNLTGPEFSEADYQSLLEMFLGYYRPWEKAVLAAEPELLRGREKTGRLEADLLDLGVGRERLQNLPVCSRLPSVQTRARRVGSMYVIEGSTLGGQILERRFAGWPTRFFGGYGDHTGAMWKAFRNLAEAEHPDDHGQVVGAAIETFETLRFWISEGRAVA